MSLSPEKIIENASRAIHVTATTSTAVGDQCSGPPNAEVTNGMEERRCVVLQGIYAVLDADEFEHTY